MTTSRPEAPVVRDWRRSAAVTALAELSGIDRHAAANRILAHDPEAALKAAEIWQLRSATSPASTTGWGAQAAPTVTETASFLFALRPKSAAAALFAKSLQVDLRGRLAVNMPRTLTDWPAPAWIDEGAPIPVAQGALTSDVIGPTKKLAALTVLTRELAELSGVPAENILSELMLESAGRTLDAALFSTTAANSIRPAGLMNGVTATTAAAASGSLQDRALADVKALTTAIAAGGGGGEIAFFAATPQATTLQSVTNLPVITAPSLAAGTLIAVDTGAIAWAGELPPEVETSKSATLHLEDTAPLAIGTVDTPNNTVAAPVRSLFQTDSIALRVVMPITWRKRSATSVQYVTGANW